jgi:hypothetical protein
VLSAGYSYSGVDNQISGSRIYGPTSMPASPRRRRMARAIMA